eukprot:CAMPEP_0171735602 /NCGR_PEP_ID=MMETSP0991-20121206/31685_1 /TAXON_ID=483369 /ORGANISM="non described non described, Strain CCMP2098" /LENGTH=184 /DNA_ID=CAMNT_0012331959 /DNA_START=357 /DNA_END=909 /DNA_ORIENTATION=+
MLQQLKGALKGGAAVAEVTDGPTALQPRQQLAEEKNEQRHGDEDDAEMRQKLKGNSEEAEGPPVEGEVPQLLREDDQRVDTGAAAAVKASDAPAAEEQQREEESQILFQQRCPTAKRYMAAAGLKGGGAAAVRQARLWEKQITARVYLAAQWKDAVKAATSSDKEELVFKNTVKAATRSEQEEW